MSFKSTRSLAAAVVKNPLRCLVKYKLHWDVGLFERTHASTWCSMRQRFSHLTNIRCTSRSRPSLLPQTKAQQNKAVLNLNNLNHYQEHFNKASLLQATSSYSFTTQVQLQGGMAFYQQDKGFRSTTQSSTPRVISERLKLHKAPSRESWFWDIDPRKVLVLFYPWLNAQEKHASKYRDLYLSHGLDVLTVSSDVKDFLWPPNSKQLARETLKTLDRECQAYEHILIHSMSIGSYNMSVMRMVAQEEEFRDMPSAHKCCGMVYDSIVAGGGKGGLVKKEHLKDNHQAASTQGEREVHAVDRMLHGVVVSVTKNPALRLAIKGTAKLYFAVTKKQTTEFYDEALEMVRENPVLARTLLLASKNDPMCDPATLEQLISIWREDGVDVELKLWDKSKHAQHLVYHKEDYLEALDLFLTHVFGSRNKIVKARL